MEYLSGGLDDSAVFEEQLNHFDVILLAGNVQRSETVKST